MARKPRVPSIPDALKVEAILWKDHAEYTAEKFNTKILHWVTIGANIYEDDEQVILGTFLDPDSDEGFYKSEEGISGSQILKAVIEKRIPLGQIPWPLTEENDA